MAVLADHRGPTGAVQLSIKRSLCSTLAYVVGTKCPPGSVLKIGKVPRTAIDPTIARHQWDLSEVAKWRLFKL
jgi:hypothetical protein